MINSTSGIKGGSNFLPKYNTPRRPWLQFYRSPRFSSTYSGFEGSGALSDSDWALNRVPDMANTITPPPTVVVLPLLPHSKTYEGNTITSARTGVIFLPVPQNATIELFRIEVGATLSGDATWNIRLNSSALFADIDRPVIGTGSKSIEKTGLSIAVIRGDDLWLDLPICPISGVSIPIVFTALLRAT